MKFDLRTALIDYDGSTIKSGMKEDDVVNMRNVINSALNMRANAPGTPDTSTPEDKAKVYMLLQKLWKRWKVDLTHDDCAFIKQKAQAVLDPLTLGRLDDFLENKKLDLPDEGEEDEGDDEADKPAGVKVTKKPSPR